MNAKAPHPSIFPNFFLVGAARCGTTSLTNSLRQHPEIFLSPLREPAFFISKQHDPDLNEYLPLFKKGKGAKAIGEVNPGYLFDENAAKLIHKVFPNSKIIMILRNPIDMAYSLWKYMVINGTEVKSFEEAIDPIERKYRHSEDFKKKYGTSWTSYVYIDRALYFKQVQRYLDIFSSDQIKIYFFEDYARSTLEVCQEIFEFLGVQRDFIPEIKVLNESGGLRFPIVKRFKNSFYPFLKPFIPMEIRANLAGWIKPLLTDKDKKNFLNSKTLLILEELFRDDIANLSILLNREIPQWGKKKV